jgi:RHS repeat-associated protein
MQKLWKTLTASAVFPIVSRLACLAAAVCAGLFPVTAGAAEDKVCVKIEISGGDIDPAVEIPGVGTFTPGASPAEATLETETPYDFTYQGSLSEPVASNSTTIFVKLTVKKGKCGKKYEIYLNGEKVGKTAEFSGSLYEGGWEPESDEIVIKPVDGASANDPGAKDGGIEGCSDCPDEDACADAQEDVGGRAARLLTLLAPPEMDSWLNLRFGVGRDAGGTGLGGLYYKQMLGTGGSVSRANFTFRKIATGAVVVTELGGVLRQVWGPEGLVDIVDVAGGAVELRYYASADVGPVVGNLFTVTGSPFIVQKLENDTDAVAGDGVLYSHTQYGATKTEGYYGTGSSTGRITRHVHANGEITEATTLLVVDPIDSSVWTRTVDTVHYDMVSSVEVPVTVTRHEYASRAWGEVLERVIQDPAGAALTTEYAYYEDAVNDGRAYRQKKHVILPTGSWEKYEYNASGSVQRTFYPWKDLPAVPTSATTANSRYVEYSYDSSGDLVTTDEYVLGDQVRSEFIYTNEYDSEYDGAQWLDLVTEERWVYHGSTFTNPLVSRVSYLTEWRGGAPSKGKLYRTVEPTGAAVRYTEEQGSYNIGTGLFSVSSGGAYTRRTEIQGTLGEVAGIANRTQKTVSIEDYKGTHRAETYVFDGTAYDLVETTVNQFESGLGRRLLSTTKDGDAIFSAVYTGFTQRVVTDAFGVETTETTDLEGDLLSSVKAGVAAGVNHEAQVAVTTSYERNGLTEATTKTAGALSSSTSTTRDLSSRVVAETDEQNRTTSYAYTTGGKTVTQTSPGGVTGITVYYLDGRIKSITGTGVVPEFHDYALDGSDNLVHTDYRGTGDATSPRWEKTTTNGQGLVIKVEKPGANGADHVTLHEYGYHGLKIRTSATGLADILYEYDLLGLPFRQGLDINANGTLEELSTDVVQEQARTFAKDVNDDWWEVSTERQFLKDNDDEVAETSVWRKLGTGASEERRGVATDGSVQTTLIVADPANKTVTSTTTHSLSSVSAVQILVNGLLVSQNSLTVSAPILYRHDALGRQTQQIDPRTDQATITAYNSLGQVSTVTNGAGDITTYTYYGSTHASAGLVATQTNDEGETIRYAFDELGRLIYQWGAATNPLAYTYNVYGGLSQLRSYRASGDWNNASLPASFASATPSVTTWGYHNGSGLLTSKTDDAAKTVSYTYYNSGLLATRTWARGVVATYGHDSAGRVTTVDYSDSTPDVTISYRRDGQRLTTTDAAGTHALTYHPDTGAPAGETVVGGLLDGLVLSWPVDVDKRPGGFSAQLGSAPLTSISYGYDAQSRLEAVSDAGHGAVYGYATNSDLLHTTTLKTGGTTKLMGARLYNNAGQVASVTWSDSAAQVLMSHGYEYNSAGRRTRAELADGSYWSYSYNDKGEVTGALKKNSTDTAYPGLDLGYTFDEIGNRLTETVDAAGGGDRTKVYTPNSLNQYTAIAHPATFNVTGAAAESSTVKINSLATERLGRYFRKEVTAGSQPSWEPITVEVTLPGQGAGGGDIVTTRQGHHYVEPASEALSYDDDGNLTSDSRWGYTWDAENRLTAMETTVAAVTLGVMKRRLEFAYDGAGRRIAKKVYDWNGGASAWALVSSRKFVYDQWNLIAELDGSGALIARYVWGMDTSQTFQGAGGVGGLLWSESLVSPAQTVFHAYDGNGNVSGLINADAASVSVRYDYNAFGEKVLEEKLGTTLENPFQFSTKYTDSETGLLYYGYRYNDPRKGRWLSRDPLEEQGGVNIYAMIGNDAVGKWDYLGLVYDIMVEREKAFPGHDILTGKLPEGKPFGRDYTTVSGSWGLGIPEPGKWGTKLPQIDIGQLFFYETDLVGTGKLAAGAKKDCPCSTHNTRENVYSCLDEFTSTGQRGRFQGFAICGHNCRTAVSEALGKCCLKRGKLLNPPVFPDTLKPEKSWERPDGSKEWNPPTPWREGGKRPW